MKRLFNKVLLGKKKSTKKSSEVEKSQCSTGSIISEGTSLIEDVDFKEVCNGRLSNVEYREVVLRRSFESEKFGLTLCYDEEGDVETNIFVSQINGIDVHTKRQAVERFGGKHLTLSLLLARNSSQHSSMATSSTPSTTSSRRKDSSRNSVPSAIREEVEENEADTKTKSVNVEEETATSSAAEKDSGISRETDSDSDSPVMPTAAAQRGVKEKGEADEARASGRLFTLIKSPRQLIAEDGTIAKASPNKTARREASVDYEKELCFLHKEMENIQLECNRLIAEHVRVEGQLQEREAYSKEYGSRRVVGKVRDETSSAYNTGDSCRSTPSHRVLAALGDYSRERDAEPSALGVQSTVSQSTPNVNSPEIKSPRSTSNKGVGVSSRSGRAARLDYLNPLFEDFADPPSTSSYNHQRPMSGDNLMNLNLNDLNSLYTDPEYLKRTILFQQHLLRRAMIKQAHKFKSGDIPENDVFDAEAFRHQHRQQSIASQSGVRLEWKLKRRSDGSRYVSRRIVRNKLLKERAQHLSQIRTGCSTDDDAVSELKMGRYWTREEKKKHLERAKERKLRQEEIIRRKSDVLRQTSGDQTLLKMSQKKLVRLQGQELLTDNYTTVRELLSNDTRTLEGKKFMGILSVTTV